MPDKIEKKPMPKILLVDDEPDIIELIQYHLEKEGYLVKTAKNGVEGLKIAKSFVPDLILLDVMMPEMDGIEACIELRKDNTLNSTLIAFLTARAEDYSHVAGLDSGADDYITKPIKPRVLLSKIKALLRRSTVNQIIKNDKVSLEINRDKYIVICEGKEFTLPKKEFELLALLFSKPGNVFTREAILAKVWGDDIVVGDRTIDVHIRKLREKIGDVNIKTIKGVGYKLNLNVN
jgi:two-component system alkaline phosphatase synthesis response regulator PhoP